MNKKLLRTALILGLLSAIGPFAIDMYLPALPSLGADLGATTAGAQSSLLSFMVAIAVCQLFYGPISDMAGRKQPLYFGMILFTLGAAGSSVAPSIEWLVAARFIQGVGACAAMALPRAIVRDEYTGVEAAQLQSMLMLVFSICPILAPLAGSIVVEFGGWRDIFWVMAGVGLLGLVLIRFGLKETRPQESRRDSTVGSALQGYRTLLWDKSFMSSTMIGAFGVSGFIAYVANSSFLLIQHYGLTPFQYSLLFSTNAVAFIGASQLTGLLAKRFGFNPVVLVASAGYLLSISVLVCLWSLGFQQLPVLATALFVGFGFLGVVLPTTAVLALEKHGEIAGTASALMGTLQLVTATIVTAIIGVFADATPLPLIIGMCACTAVAFALTFLLPPLNAADA